MLVLVLLFFFLVFSLLCSVELGLFMIWPRVLFSFRMYSSVSCSQRSLVCIVYYCTFKCNSLYTYGLRVCYECFNERYDTAFICHFHVVSMSILNFLSLSLSFLRSRECLRACESARARLYDSSECSVFAANTSSNNNYCTKFSQPIAKFVDNSAEPNYYLYVFNSS